MGYNFLAVERDQAFLMPPSLTEWLEEDHLAWFVLDAVEQMDLTAFRADYRADGWRRPGWSRSAGGGGRHQDGLPGGVGRESHPGPHR